MTAVRRSQYVGSAQVEAKNEAFLSGRVPHVRHKRTWAENGFSQMLSLHRTRILALGRSLFAHVTEPLEVTASSPELLDQQLRGISALMRGQEVPAGKSKGEDHIGGNKHRPKPGSAFRPRVPARGSRHQPVDQPTNCRQYRWDREADEKLQSQRKVIGKHRSASRREIWFNASIKSISRSVAACAIVSLRHDVEAQIQRPDAMGERAH
jgi:hypothetical protein